MFNDKKNNKSTKNATRCGGMKFCVCVTLMHGSVMSVQLKAVLQLLP